MSAKNLKATVSANPSSPEMDQQEISFPKKVKSVVPLLSNKDLRFNLKVRVYGFKHDSTCSHSYLMADMPLGISPGVGDFIIDVRAVTLMQLRMMIQYDQRTQMKKRSMMFQEVLFIMSQLPNLYNRPKLELNKYQFGFVRKDGLDVKLIHPSRENEPIAGLIGATDFFGHDLIIVPLSQIPLDLPVPLSALAPEAQPRQDQNTAPQPTAAAAITNPTTSLKPSKSVTVTVDVSGQSGPNLPPSRNAGSASKPSTPTHLKSSLKVPSSPNSLRSKVKKTTQIN